MSTGRFVDPDNLAVIVDLLGGDLDRVYDVLGDFDVDAFKPDELDPVQRDDLFYALGMLAGAGHVLDMTVLQVFDASWPETISEIERLVNDALTTTTEDKP